MIPHSPINISPHIQLNSPKQNSNNNQEQERSITSIKKEKKTFFLFQYFKNICIAFYKCLKNKKNSILLYLNFPTEIVIFLFPILSISFTLSILFHHYFYGTILFKDYNSEFKIEVLDTIINKENEMEIKMASDRVYYEFEDKISNIIFTKVYLKEMIRHHILSNKTILNISKLIYSDLDNIQFRYSIEEEQIIKYLDNDTISSNNLNELAKIYYLFFPYIISESKSYNNIIRDSFLITYEFNDSLNVVDKFFFNFPSKKKILGRSSNFNVNNIYTEPYIIEENNLTLTKEENEDFYRINWFYEKDLEFRKNINKKKSKLSIENYNSIIESSLSQYHFLIIQYYFEYNNKKFITNNIVSFEQSNAKFNHFDYFIFTMENDETNSKIKQFSDNRTYTISGSKINSLSQSEIYSMYFKLGMKRLNSSFFLDGINYDTFDIEQFNNLNEYYDIIETFKADVSVFSSFFFFGKFLQNIKNIQNNENLLISGFTNKTLINEICGYFNYSAFFEFFYKFKNHINCLSQNEMYYYKETHNIKINEKDNLTFQRDFPHCNCVPLYCLNYQELKNLNDDDFLKLKLNIDNNPEKYIVTNLSLPKKCYLKFYGYEQINKSNIDSYSLNKYLHGDYYNISYISDFTLFLLNVVDNGFYESLINFFKNKLNQKLNKYYLFFDLFVTFNMFLFIIYLFKILRKFSLIIHEFKNKHEAFMFNMEIIKKNEDYSPNINEIEEEDKLSIQNITSFNNNDIKDSSENHPLISSFNENKNEVNNLDNTLLDEVFIIFCKYFNLDPEQVNLNLEKNEKGSKLKAKIELMKEKNELWDLLVHLSQDAPKFRLNLSLDINLYQNTKLNKNFLKGICKIKGTEKRQIYLTQNVLYELLSTERVSDYGLVLNLHFNYIDNSKKNMNDAIKKTMFEDANISKVKLICKKREEIIDEFEKGFEGDDFLKLDKLESTFNFFLINVYHKYITQIIEESHND